MPIGSKVLQFVESIDTAASSDVVENLLFAAFDYLGFDSVAAVKLPGPNETLEDTTFANNRSSEFATLYYEQNFDTRDPVIEQFSLNSSSYTWSSAYKSSNISDRENLLGLAKTYKMHEGIVVPIVQLNAHGLVSAATSSSSITNEQFHASNLLSISAFSKFVSLKNVNKANYQALHWREAECLQWIAVGKSDKEISEITNLSPNTVRNYIESAKVKLGSPNRTAAAVTAFRLGFIHL